LRHRYPTLSISPGWRCNWHNPRERLAAVRAAARHATPLFDTDRFRGHIEAAYLSMVERQRSGLPPAAFAIRLTAE
jgi:hypothetical protein